jgi:methionyl-tRNA synthetase
MAKDILKFHAVIWPAMLLSAGYAVPEQIFIHGYLLLDELKISKSLGNAIDPLELIDTYGADAVRFWCARAVTFGQDGSASLSGIADRYERELGNDLGNLLSRTTAMIARYRDGSVPGGPAAGSELEAVIADIRDNVPRDLDGFDITGAVDRIWTLVRHLNRYVTERAPWTLAKDESKGAELDQVLYDLADGLRVSAIALWPYLPETAPKILEALGQPVEFDWERVEYGRLAPTTTVEAAPPLFPRFEATTA